MLLALDVGNTNITLGVYEGEKLLFVARMATNPPRRAASSKPRSKPNPVRKSPISAKCRTKASTGRPS